jgi:VanZ family protein
MTDEYHQLHVAGRFASFGDVAADFLGAFAGGFLIKRYSVRRSG